MCILYYGEQLTDTYSGRAKHKNLNNNTTSYEIKNNSCSKVSPESKYVIDFLSILLL